MSNHRTMQEKLDDLYDKALRATNRAEEAEAEAARLRTELKTAYADGNSRVDELSKDNARQSMVSKALARKLAHATGTWGKAGNMDNSEGYWMAWAEHDADSEIKAAREAVAGEGK